ncbi:hypothetical protein [Moraxella sp. VT-16-12]|uniref:hypothetical protein n=1 Tax=Moraxella sp. VT-16-12 TaxID=2014877 RepID=UPI000B7CD873|nr:hypothetical protein [Moraxella sp. VT-16-12]TWV80176.1 hypothetical protein CEW93_010470 [Moraxella sp. VT-16-12]
MRMKSDFVLTGAKPFNETIEGKVFDQCKIFLELTLSDGNGKCTVEYVWGDHTNYKHFENLALPVDVLVDFELVTTGKRQKTIIHDVQVKKPVKA